MINDLPSVGTALPEEINAAINTQMSGPDTEARELTEREARRALREQFGQPPDFEDTSPGWEIEPTEEQAIRNTLRPKP